MLWECDDGMLSAEVEAKTPEEAASIYVASGWGELSSPVNVTVWVRPLPVKGVAHNTMIQVGCYPDGTVEIL